MTDAAVFRWVIAATFVAVVGITAPHRWKARTSEKLDRKKEGAFILATLRPVAGALYASIIAYVSNPASMAWSQVTLPLGLRWCGAGFCALCVVLLLWTLPTLGTNLTDTVVTRERHTLVTRGPYRWIRHPFYVSIALVAIGASLLAANWFMLASGAVAFVLLAVRSRVEEEQLAARFGDPYREYQQRTGKFLPKF